MQKLKSGPCIGDHISSLASIMIIKTRNEKKLDTYDAFIDFSKRYKLFPALLLAVHVTSLRVL